LQFNFTEMKYSIIILCLFWVAILSGCKKDTVNTPIESPTSKQELPENVSNPTPHLNSTQGTITPSSNGTLSNTAPLKFTAWYGFINVEEQGDLYNYFVRYAEYRFVENQMEFFANMVNAKQMKNYEMRSDSIFFIDNGLENFQFTILERSEDKMKVKAATGKINTLLKIPDADLSLTRKERIKASLMRINHLDKTVINEKFEALKDVTIN